LLFAGIIDAVECLGFCFLQGFFVGFGQLQSSGYVSEVHWLVVVHAL